jgi:hypothetical protein
MHSTMKYMLDDDQTSSVVTHWMYSGWSVLRGLKPYLPPPSGSISDAYGVPTCAALLATGGQVPCKARFLTQSGCVCTHGRQAV